MAGEAGPQTHPLTGRFADALEQEPYRFDFFRVVRHLDALRAGERATGETLRPGEDPVRFCQDVALTFPPASLTRFDRRGGRAAPRLYVRFLGLFGAGGPMPLVMTEYVRERERNHRDSGVARFFDIFHHRAISLFYRAWAIAEKTVQFERGPADRFAAYVASLCGLGMESLRVTEDGRPRDRMPHVAKLYYAGLLAGQTRHPDGLRQTLADYFSVPVVVEEFIGRWLEIPRDRRCRLGDSPAVAGLGTTAVVGARAWDCQSTFRLRLGPLDLSSYERLLPCGGGLEALAAWVRTYAGDALAWELQLVLRADHVPRTTLGRYGRVGWNTWLGVRSGGADADDLVLQPPIR